MVQGSLQGTCDSPPEVLALGGSRWNVISRGTVRETGESWTYNLNTTADAKSVLAFCESEKRSEGVLLLNAKTLESGDQDIEIVNVPEPAAKVGQAALDAAKGSVDLAIGLIGYIALFRLMKIVEEAGGLRFMARDRPLMVRPFPIFQPITRRWRPSS